MEEQIKAENPELITVAGLQLPQKVYPWSSRDKYIMLFGWGFIGLFYAFLSASFFWLAITELQIPLLHRGLIVIGTSLIVILFIWFFQRLLRQRFEISAEGMTLFTISFALYVPWENILAYDPHAHYPGRIQHQYGGFVYKEPALLYTSVKQGKAQGRTVVQMSRVLSTFHPNIIDYLSHYFPLLPEFLPEKEYERLFDSVSQEQGEGSRYTYRFSGPGVWFGKPKQRS